MTRGGSKRSSRAHSRAATTEEESDESRQRGDAEEPSTKDTELDTIIDDLYEKRTSTRERALQRLVLFLSSAPSSGADCQDQRETLRTLLVNSIKRGGPTEAHAACQALGMLFVTLPSPALLLRETAELLERTVLYGGEASVRGAAAEALGLGTFVSSDDPCEGRRCCQFLSEAAQKLDDAATMISCLRAWALVASALPAWILSGEFLETHLAVLHTLLHHNDVDVRAAAGEGLAVLQSVADAEALEEAGGEAFVDLAASPAGAGGGHLSGEEGDGEASTAVSTVDQSLEMITERMAALASNRGDRSVKQRSKKDRAQLKSTFRTLNAALQDGVCPETHVRLKHGDVLTVNTWNKTTQLNFLRRYLATGFQAHLQYNPLLHEIFEITPAVERQEEYRGKREKSQVSKALTLDRKADRELAMSRKGSKAMLASEWGGHDE